MKSLRWAGLVFSLLIVGVLGGLMAPLPSEATHGGVHATPPEIRIIVKVPGDANSPYTLTLSVANGKLYPATDTTFSTCDSGYTYCFGLHTQDNGDSSMVVGSSTRQYKLVRYTPTGGSPAKARLMIADNPGTSNDILELTGLSLVAVCPGLSGGSMNQCTTANWPGTTKVYLQLEVSHTFDARPNDVSLSTLMTITEGGFISTLASTNTSTAGDKVQIYGKGNFGSGLVNINNATNNKDADDIPTTPAVTNGPFDGNVVVNANACITGNASKSTLCTTNANQTQVSFGLGHTSPFPAFSCSNGRTGSVTVTDFGTTARAANTYTYTNPKCTPSVTFYHFFTDYGPDSIHFSTSINMAMGPCGPKPLPSCTCTDNPKKSEKNLCNDFVALNQKHLDKEKEAQGEIPDLTPCDVDNCNVTFATTINATTPGLTAGTCLDSLNNLVPCNVYPFLTAGPIIEPFTITVNPSTKFGQLQPDIQGLISGDVGAQIIVYPDYEHWPILGTRSNPVFQEIDQAVLTSDLGTTIVGTDVVTINCPSGDKMPIVGYRFGAGDTVRAAIHVKAAQSQPHICPIPELQ